MTYFVVIMALKELYPKKIMSYCPDFPPGNIVVNFIFHLAFNLIYQGKTT